MAKRKRKQAPQARQTRKREPRRLGSGVAVALLGGLVLALVAFSPTFSNGTISFDDPRYVVSNPEVRAGLDAEFVRWAFTSRHAYNWHPLTWFSHAVDISLFGDWWGGHHAMSLVLHLAAALLLFGFLRAAIERPWLSFWVALLFAIHPLRVESVAWLSERKDTLSAVFFFGALWAYVRYVHRSSPRRWFAWTLLGVCGLMSKPMLVTLPFVLLLLDFWPLQRTSSRTPHGTLLLEKLPLFGAVLVSIGLTLWAQQPIVQDLEQYPSSARLSNALVSVLRYCGKLLWPNDLGIFYPHPGAAGWPPTLVLASALFVLACSGLLWRARGRMPWALVGWLWFLGTLVPVLGLVQVGLQSMADRYTYLPSVGLLIAAVWSIDHALSGLGDERTRRWRMGLCVVGSLVSVALALLTFWQTQHWRGDVSLLTHTITATKGSFWAHYNLGLVHQREGRQDLAEEQFEQALHRQPENVETLRNLGHLLAQDPGRAGEARRLFEQAVEIRPEDAFAQIDLAEALARAGDHEAAVSSARLALRRRPQEGSWWMLLGRSLVQLGELREAEEVLREAVDLDGGQPEAWNALGVAVAQQQRFAEAVPFFERALELQPRHVEAARNLAAARRLSS